jgi:CRISPR system Cascade subunit CasB
MEQPQPQPPAPPKEAASYEDRFVNAVFEACKKDKGLAARLRRADNPDTEYQSWEFLARFGVNLEKDWDRLSFATLAAAISKGDQKANGSVGLGKALLSCYDGDQNGAGKARLLRLLTCDDLNELCRVLRPLLSLVASRGSAPLDYARLLRQVRWFSADPQRVRAQWAQDYYGIPAPKSKGAKP